MYRLSGWQGTRLKWRNNKQVVNMNVINREDNFNVGIVCGRAGAGSGYGMAI
jgi:hypothetical protein